MNENHHAILSSRSMNFNQPWVENTPLFNEGDLEENMTEEIQAIVAETDCKNYERLKTNLIRQQRQFRLRWIVIMTLLSLYTCVVVPFCTAFYENRSVILVLVDLGVDFCFVVDIVFKFLTTYIDKSGKEVADLKEIANNYLKGYFFIDFISSFPLDKILMLKLSRTASVITIIQILKLLRVYRIIFTRKIVSAALRLVSAFLLFFLVLHITGCIWFIIVREPQSWIPYQDIEKGSTNLYTSDIWNAYFICFHQAIWLIFGQEILPSTLYEIWACCISIAFGTLLTSYIFGEILMVVSSLGLKFEQRRKALEQSLSVIDRMKISKELKTNILDYITTIYPTLSSQEEFERLFHYISPRLQKEVLQCIYKPMFTSNYLLEKDSKLSYFIINRVSYSFYQPEEQIINEGARASDFFILVRGVCSVYVKMKNGKKSMVGNLEEGSHFGEIGLIYRNYRTATVVSHGYSTAARLGKNEFRILTNAFPYIIDKLKAGVKQYNDSWRTFVLNIFKQSELLSSLPEEVLIELIYKAKLIKIHRDEYLFKAGELIKGVYAVAFGSLNVTFMLNSISENKIKRVLSSQSAVDTENNEDKKVMVNISVAMGMKIKAEVVPVMTEDSEDDKAQHNLEKEAEIYTLTQGSLVYSSMPVKKGKCHIFNCKANENVTVYLIDNEIIKQLIKQHTAFKKISDLRPKEDYFEFYNTEDEGSGIRLKWKKAIVSVILDNRTKRDQKRNRSKDLVEKLRAIVACERSGNHKLVEDVINGVVPYKFITKEGMIDRAIMYKGSIPESHPIIRAFDNVLKVNSKNSMIKQCNSLHNEVLAEVQKIKNCRQRILNTVGLLQTLIDERKSSQ